MGRHNQIIGGHAGLVTESRHQRHRERDAEGIKGMGNEEEVTQPKLNLIKFECQRSHMLARISLNRGEKIEKCHVKKFTNLVYKLNKLRFYAG